MNQTRQPRTVVALLSLNAALLAALLWVQVNGAPLLDRPAAAQERTLPNAGAQRAQIIDQLGALRDSVEACRRLLASGNLRAAVRADPEPPPPREPRS